MQAEKKTAFWKSPLAVLLVVIILILVLSWVIPSGVYEREQNSDGQSVVIPGTYSPVEKVYVSPLELPELLVQGLTSVAPMLIMMLLGGAAMQVIIETGSIQWFVNMLRKNCGNRPEFMIAFLTTSMGLLSLSASITGYIALTPLFVSISYAMGYDAMLGAAMLIVGTGVGFSCGALRSTTTAVAQAIAELPLFSGLGYRLISFCVLMAGSVWFLIHYAHGLYKCNPNSGKDSVTSNEPTCSLHPVRRVLVLLSFVGCIGFMAVGCMKWNWGMNQLSALFIVEAFLGSLASGTDLELSCRRFLKGFKEASPVCLITGIAATAGVILQEACVLDTVVYGAECFLSNIPGIVAAPAMFVVNFLINIFIGSGSGQAVVVMPIMAPVSDMLGISRQIAVLAYNFGDGLCNYILPTASVLVGPLALAKISYGEWMKTMKWLFVLWFVLALVLMIFAQLISYT